MDMKVEGYHSPTEQSVASKSEKTSEAELDRLANSEYEFVKLNVARNRITALETLKTLMPARIETAYEQSMAEALSKNLKITREMTEHLLHQARCHLDNGRGNQSYFTYALQLCILPQTPFKSIEALIQDARTSTQFKKVLARETSRKDTLNILLNDKNEIVRRKAAATLANIPRSIPNENGGR